MTRCANLAQESVGRIVDFPARLVRRSSREPVLTSVAGLPSVFIQCYARAALPSELPGIDWAVAGPVAPAAHYNAFGGAGVS